MMAKRTPAAGRTDSHPFARETGDAAMTQQLVDQFLNDTRTHDLTPIFSPFGMYADQLKVRLQQAIEYGRTTHAEITSSSERGSNASRSVPSASGIARAFAPSPAEAAAKDFAEVEASIDEGMGPFQQKPRLHPRTPPSKPIRKASTRKQKA